MKKCLALFLTMIFFASNVSFAIVTDDFVEETLSKNLKTVDYKKNTFHSSNPIIIQVLRKQVTNSYICFHFQNQFLNQIFSSKNSRFFIIV